MCDLTTKFVEKFIYINSSMISKRYKILISDFLYHFTGINVIFKIDKEEYRNV